MSTPFWAASKGQAFVDQAARVYGERSVVLSKLSALAEDMGFSVPEFLVFPVDFARQITERYQETQDQEGFAGYLALSEKRVAAYQTLLEPFIPEIAAAVRTITSTSPILRGSSSVEGSSSLSFAGVCKTVIPQQDLRLEEYLQKGVARVLAGSFTPYANYYLTHHNIDAVARNVALIAMELVSTPIVHAAAYVYPNELRVRYFLNPIVGSRYSGGHEMILRRDKLSLSDFPDHARELAKDWTHIASTLWNLHESFYGEPVLIDVEFLVDQQRGKNVLHIVQLRPISKPHVRNYLQVQTLPECLPGKAAARFVITPSHLYHSVGKVSKGSVVDLRGASSDIQAALMRQSVSSPVFLVSHEAGEGTFGFLKALPSDSRDVVVLISHPEHRPHDHLQYAVYEDRRLSIVVHCTDVELSGLAHGNTITLDSDGNHVTLNIVTEN